MRSACQFPWCKYSHSGQFQTASVRSRNSEHSRLSQPGGAAPAHHRVLPSPLTSGTKPPSLVPVVAPASSLTVFPRSAQTLHPGRHLRVPDLPETPLSCQAWPAPRMIPHPHVSSFRPYLSLPELGQRPSSVSPACLGHPYYLIKCVCPCHETLGSANASAVF